MPKISGQNVGNVSKSFDHFLLTIPSTFPLFFSEFLQEVSDDSDTISVPSTPTPSTSSASFSPGTRREKSISPGLSTPIVSLTKMKADAKKALAQRNRPTVRIEPDSPYDFDDHLSPLQLLKVRYKARRPDFVRKPQVFSSQEKSEKIQEFVQLMNQMDVRADVSFIFVVKVSL